MVSTNSWPPSPFLVGQAIEEDALDALFVGREAITDPVLALIKAGGRGALIHGPRRFGKTSVLNYIERHLGASTVVGRVDLRLLWDQRAETGWAPGEIVPRALEWLVASLGRQLTLADDLRYPFAPEMFRTVALPRIREALNGRRLVLFFDELEVLHDEDPSAVRSLLSAVNWQHGGGSDVSLIIIWGRRFGDFVTGGQPSPLKDLRAYHLEALTTTDVESLVNRTFKSFAVWPPKIAEYLHGLTNGHPLFVVALCDEVWRKLAAETADRPVEIADLEVAIKPASERLVVSLDDVWQQLDLPARLVLRAVAGLAARPETAATVQDIAATLHNAGRKTDEDEVEQACRALHASHALVLEGRRSRVVSPVLAEWLTTYWSLQGIIADHQEDDKVKLEAKRSWAQGREAEARGDLDGAMACYLRASDLDPTMWNAGFAAAQIELQRGSIDEALARLRGLPPMAEVLRARRETLLRAARTAWIANRSPDEALDELQRLDPGLGLTLGADAFVAEMKVEQWRRSLEQQPIGAWERACEDLESTAPPLWWPSAATHFGQLLQEHLDPPRSDDAARTRPPVDRAVALVTIVLPWLARAAPSDSSTLGDVARTAAEWQAAGIGADSSVGEKLAEFLSLLKAEGTDASATGAGHQRMGSAWKLATALLEQILRGKGDLEQANLSVRRLEKLVQAAPKSIRNRLADVFNRWLGSRMFDALESELYEAKAIARVAVVLRDPRLLGDVVEACLKKVFEAIDAPRPELTRALVLAWPGVVSPLLRAIKEGTLPSETGRDLADQTTLLLDQVDEPIDWGEDFWTHEVAFLRDDWGSLLAQFPSLAESAGRLIDEHFPEYAPTPSAAKVKTRLLTDGDVSRLLGEEYTDLSREPRYRVPRVPIQALQAFRATKQGVRLLVRVYAVEASDPDTQAFLQHLWDTERRILYDLGTRWEGRALPRLYDARFDPDTGALMLVTERLGTSTIRDHLNDGRVSHERREDSATLWKHLASLFSAVAAMHDAGFLHRSIRPEHIRIDEAAEQTATARYRLADFESAVFLYGLDSAMVAARDQLDRYCAPEVLEAEFTRHRVAAESRAADAYAVGLLVYECVVGPLQPLELLATSGSWSYEEHSAWLRGLIRRVPSSLFEQERQILRRLLAADPNERCSDLSELIPLANRLATGSRGPEALFDEIPALCVTTFSTGASSIERFIKSALPGIEFVNEDAVRRFVEADLIGAAVHRNWREDRAPLVVLGTQLSYTIQPLVYDNRTHPAFGWLEVARQDDMPEGPELAHLKAGVQLHHIHTGMNLSGLRREGSSWQPLFDLVGIRMDALGAHERRFHHLLRLMTDHEESVAAESVLQVEVVHHQVPERWGDEEEITLRLIQDEKVRGDLPEFLAHWFDHESHFFSVDGQRDPFAEFSPNRRWMLRVAGATQGSNRRKAKTASTATFSGNADEAILWRVHQRTNEAPPKPLTYIRPYLLQGLSALHRRHLEVLNDLRYDPFLMRAVVRPQDTATDLRRGAGRVFDDKLDESKRTLAHAIRDRQPLFCVQGPPGTGKTTQASCAAATLACDRRRTSARTFSNA